MINNDSPGFLPDGTVNKAGIASGFSIPPSTVRTLGEAPNEKNISWAYYGGAYNAAVNLQHNSGSIQLDFFGDGPRTPLIVVSPFTKGGHINHTYTGHVSILEFVERNWHLGPLKARGRGDPYRN